MSKDPGTRDSSEGATPKGKPMKVDFGQRSINLQKQARSTAPIPGKKIIPKPGRLPVGKSIPIDEVLNAGQKSKS